MKQDIKINVGSKNPTKIDAVKQIFVQSEIYGLETDSLVSSQPMSDLETKEGAINRALASRNKDQEIHGIGLEGGVMQIKDTFFLCNWGALSTIDEKLFVASGARIPLPVEIKNALLEGKELGDIMDEFQNKEGIRNNEGAIGIFTYSTVNRSTMFQHVVQLLYGQWLFHLK